eukprot:1566372-Amphidinium_carterae.1
MNWVVSFGKYEEGQVWIEQKNGRFAPPNLPNSPLCGEYHSTYRRWLSFDPKRQHAVEAVVGWQEAGTRVARRRKNSDDRQTGVLHADLANMGLGHSNK